MKRVGKIIYLGKTINESIKLINGGTRSDLDKLEEQINSANDPILMHDNGEVYKDSFVWIHYKYSLYKSEAGEVILKPTIRLLQKKEGNEIISSRNKFELTTVMKFR